MIALHVSISDGVPFLWGETGVASCKDGVKTPFGCPAYPFNPGLPGLRNALARLACEIRVSRSNTGQAVVWLPSCGNVPVPSSPLLGPAPDQRRKSVIAPFTTTVRQLSPAELFELAALAESPAVGTGVIFGASLAWCEDLLRLVSAVGIQEAFLPGLIRGAKEWEARWLPVPDEAAQQRIADLAAAMPGVCRCLSATAEVSPETPPLSVANHLLARCLDGLVRRSAIAEINVEKRPPRHVSLHDAWLAALTFPTAVVAWPNEAELKELFAQLGRWQRPVDLTAQSPFRFCFRLSEPSEGDVAEWRVDYLLQAKADPSLQVSVGDLWKPRSRASQQIKKIGGQPTEFLLTALGQAAGLCPAVATSLKAKYPGGFSLDTAGAFVFLRDQAEALRGAGFTVMLPSWWVGRGPTKRLGLKIRGTSPKMQGSGGLSLEAMVDFDFSASLGGEVLSLAELHALARLKAPLVQVRGQWTQIDPEQIQAALRFLENRGQHQPLSARDLLRLALGAEDRFGGLPVDSVETDGWLQEVLDKLTGRREFATIEQPQGLAGQLRPYQQRGYSWLAFLRQWGLGACLADDMGLGKTVQTLALIERERAAGEIRPVLLLCPTTVVNNWRKEAEKFTPELGVHIHHGSDRHRKKDFATVAQRHALVVSSYGLLQRDLDFLQEINWAGIILDEAQNIKNPEAKQSKAARAMRADYRIALTGTPVENHVGDLWALMDFLNPGLLGNQNAFKQHFYRPIQIWRDADRAAQLKRLTGPFLLRRLKTDRSIISDLPEKIEVKEFCTLSREQASLYAAVLDDMQKRLEQAEGIERRGLVLATLSKLKQVCNHPAHFIGDGSALDGRSGKLARLKELLSELYELKERTLVFTQYAEMGGLLQQYFQEQFGREVFFLHGGVSRKRRDDMVERFQNDAQAPLLFILSLKAGGTGLTLTRANHVVHYDRWWNPAVENQATDRAFRIGQKRNVQVHKFLVAGTLEERIDKMIEFKSGIAGEIVGTGEQWLTELSNDDLRDLLKLGSEAVGD